MSSKISITISMCISNIIIIISVLLLIRWRVCLPCFDIRSLSTRTTRAQSFTLPPPPPPRPVSPSRQDQLTPLHYAAACGHAAVVELLLQRGANTEAVESVVRTCRVDGGGVGEECAGMR